MPAEDRVVELVAQVAPPDAAAEAAARARHDQLTKPRGSLGELEALGVRLAAMAGRCPPPVPQRPAVIVAAGRAAVNALARVAGAQVTVLDVGVATAVAPHPAVRRARVRPGTADLSQEPAMSREEAAR